MDRFDPHTVGGLIEVDPSRFNERRGRCRVELRVSSQFYIAKFAIAATCAGWSKDETKPSWVFGGLARFKANYIDGVVWNRTIYEKVAAQLREAR